MPLTCTSTTGTSAGTRSLWLVRHGESTWNTLGLAQGHNDQPELTSRGRRQASSIAERLRGIPIGAIYASDLRRAWQTAAPLAVAAGVPVVLDRRLRERGLGVLEGTPAAANGPSATGLDLNAGRITDPDKRPDGGESVRDLYNRAAAFLDDLAAGALPAIATTATAQAAADPEGDVVIVAHGGTVRVLAARLGGVPVEQMNWAPLDNATVLKFPYRAGGML
jgi:probable phosphoglycerate mutase